MTVPRFFFGAMSPYSWFAAERIEALLPGAAWQPVFAGALFKANGRSSWGLDDRREAGLDDCQARARRHGLGTILWPEPWPTNDVLVARAMTYAARRDLLAPLALAAMRMAFREGADLGDPVKVGEAGERVGIAAGELAPGAPAPARRRRLYDPRPRPRHALARWHAVLSVDRPDADTPAVEPALPPDRLLAILETQHEIAATALDLDAVMALVAERARALTGAAASVVELADGDVLVYRVGSGAAESYVGSRGWADSGLSGLCALRGKTLHCADARIDARVDSDACRRAGALSMVCVPLSHAGRVAGVLTVYDPRPNAFLKKDVVALDLLSGAIGAHMAQAKSAQQQHDALTGLPNRPAFDRRLAQELARVTRHGGQFTLSRFDLGWLTQTQESDGPAAADVLLQAVAGHLGQLRGEDSAYRLGGNEFALLLIEASEGGAEAVLERVSKAIKQDPGGHRVRLAWGVATFQTGDDAISIVARAELALYDAKRALAA